MTALFSYARSRQSGVSASRSSFRKVAKIGMALKGMTGSMAISA
jgi:hypothetical protein